MSDLSRFSVFVCNNYLPLFISFYNSYKYYNHTIPLNVYDYKGLNTFNLQYLKNFVSVTPVTHEYPINHFYLNTYAFKFVSLLENMYDNEIVMDVDTNFLNNLDFVFDDIKKGNAVFAEEKPEMYCKAYSKQTDWELELLHLKKVLEKHIPRKNLDLFHPEYRFKNNNGGFMGFNKEKHRNVLKTVLNILYDESLRDYLFLIVDQYAMSFFMGISPEIEQTILPSTTWMNTWWAHGDPKKRIEVIDKKLALLNVDGSRINFYHYTGGIGVPCTDFNDLVPARLFLLTDDYFMKRQGKYVANKEAVQKLWINDYENPIMFLYEYFYNNGEIKCPKIYNINFRKNISNIFKTFFETDCNEESECVIMVALLYDYINLLGYELVGNHPYHKILDYLQTSHKSSNKKIGIDCREATVSLSIKQPEGNSYDWFDAVNTTGNDVVVENLNNVFITTKMKEISI
jgi:hypothetical protein